MTRISPIRKPLTRAKRLVVKVGTAVVTSANGSLALGRIGAIVEEIEAARAGGCQVILVSSGAIGLGQQRLGLRVRNLVDQQASAAAGQGALMAFYDGLFGQRGITTAQVLLTEQDFYERHRYLNLAATLERLLELNALPIINENDTVSTAELAGSVFGDNDRLSCLVAAGLHADAVVLLTNVDGVYTAPPSEPNATRIAVFDEDARAEFEGVSGGGRGGMAAKVGAAQLASRAGVHAVVASGLHPNSLGQILRGEEVGTVFPATLRILSKRRQWLAFASAPTGRLIVNAGAREAMVTRFASLLAPGLTAIEGEFEEGSVLSILCENRVEFARGICKWSSVDIRASLVHGGSLHRQRPLVHRNNVVIFSEEK